MLLCCLLGRRPRTVLSSTPFATGTTVSRPLQAVCEETKRVFQQPRLQYHQEVARGSATSGRPGSTATLPGEVTKGGRRAETAAVASVRSCLWQVSTCQGPTSRAKSTRVLPTRRPGDTERVWRFLGAPQAHRHSRTTSSFTQQRVVSSWAFTVPEPAFSDTSFSPGACAPRRVPPCCCALCGFGQVCMACVLHQSSVRQSAATAPTAPGLCLLRAPAPSSSSGCRAHSSAFPGSS